MCIPLDVICLLLGNVLVNYHSGKPVKGYVTIATNLDFLL